MPADKEFYCPYTDRVLPATQASNEHIVPLALGGADPFSLPVCRNFNSTVGSSIDGAMANDFLVAMERTRYDARGHSGKRPTAHIKHASYGPTARPAQAHFSVKEGLAIFDAIEGRILAPHETAGTTISCRTTTDIDLRLKFVAKVGLSAGYLVYPGVFRDSVAHCELRGVMNQKKGENLDKYRDSTIRADDPLLTPKPSLGSQLEIVRGVCNAIKGSLVMLIPSATSLMVAVGVLGKYVGMLNVAADTTAFPNSGAYSWGHVIVLTGGRMQRESFSTLLHKFTSFAPRPAAP